MLTQTAFDWIEEKREKKNDPTASALRTGDMLKEADTLVSEDSQSGYASDNRTLHGLRKHSKKASMTNNTGTEAHWVNLLHRIAANEDRVAFSELFAHFAPRVKAFLMKSGADASLAEECSQDVLATVWRKSHLFDPSRASVATWIFTIARNRRIDALRKQRRPEPEELTWGPEAEPDQADVLTLQQESARLTQAIAELPDKQRELIEKAYFGDLSHSEIANDTGLPLGTIKSRIRLALERLRHAMS